MDIDNDGNRDVITGTYTSMDGNAMGPGYLYIFQGQADGSFAAGEIMENKAGERLSISTPENAPQGPAGLSNIPTHALATVPFATDWDNDGDLDLLVGNIVGEVHLFLNEGSADAPAFATESEALTAGGKTIGKNHSFGGDSGPVTADWDSDGDLDLIVGYGDGSVQLYENTGTRNAPTLAAAKALVQVDNSDPMRMYRQPTTKEECDRPVQLGSRVKVCVADYNNDGLLDLIVGDYNVTYTYMGELTEEQQETKKALEAEMGEIQEKVMALFRNHQGIGMGDAWKESLTEDEVKEIEDEFAATRDAQMELHRKLQKLQTVSREACGFVWVYLRDPKASEPTAMR